MAEMYLTGGAVRDYRLRSRFTEYRKRIKDFDFTVEATNYSDMRLFVQANYKVNVVQEDPRFGRFKGSILVKDLPQAALLLRMDPSNLTPESTVFADFVLARAGCTQQHPSHIKVPSVSSISSDLARRDLTINSMAYDMTTGEFLDNHNGEADIATRVLRFTGDISDRLAEDYLRVVRIYRFLGVLSYSDPDTYWEGCTGKDWIIVESHRNFIREHAKLIASGLKETVSRDRIAEEMRTLFKYVPTLAALDIIRQIPLPIQRVIFDREKKLWLMPSMEKTYRKDTPFPYSLPEGVE